MGGNLPSVVDTVAVAGAHLRKGDFKLPTPTKLNQAVFTPVNIKTLKNKSGNTVVIHSTSVKDNGKSLGLVPGRIADEYKNGELTRTTIFTKEGILPNNITIEYQNAKTK